MAKIRIPHDRSIRIILDPASPETWAGIYHCTPDHDFIYTFRDKSGDVLYVGITWSAKARWSSHRRKKLWWSEVRSVDLTCREKTHLALDHERYLIASLNPKYNIRSVKR